MRRFSHNPFFTKLGLMLAFFGASLVLIPFQLFAPSPLTNSIVIVREIIAISKNNQAYRPEGGRYRFFNFSQNIQPR